MPSSVGTSLLGFGAVLTTVSDTAGCIVAGLGVVWEALVFYRAGRV